MNSVAVSGFQILLLFWSFIHYYSAASGFYKRTKRTRDWPAGETIKFYRCLHTIGTDFSLMLTLFPKRTRRDLKLKFKREEKYNLSLINKALLHPKQFNIDDLKIELEREEEADEVRKKLEWQQLKDKQAKMNKYAPFVGDNFRIFRITMFFFYLQRNQEGNEKKIKRKSYCIVTRFKYFRCLRT